MGIMRQNGAYKIFFHAGVYMSKVLERLLKRDVLPEKSPEAFKKLNRPGRPVVSEEKKAKNFTLCLAPQYLTFLDKMVVKDPKVKGRGRKIRFIIERFIEHEKRGIGQMKVLKESLMQVQAVLNSFGSRVKKGEKMDLSPKEKATMTKAVDNVHLLLKILHYSPKTLHRLMPREEWAILSFCLDWKNNRGITL
jgi:hypothetical protein